MLLATEVIFLSFRYQGSSLPDNQIRFIRTKAFLRLNMGIFLTPIIHLSSANFERIVKDRARSIMILYFNGNCDLCNSLQNVLHNVGGTFRNEPKCLIGRLNCDADPQICVQQNIPHYPTLKVYSQHNKDGVMYEPGRNQESYTEKNITSFMNALCGTQRILRGRLNEKVGRNVLDSQSIFIGSDFKLFRVENSAIEKMRRIVFREEEA